MFKRELALRPNCLLTRRPLYFLTGPRSLFYYRNPWKDLHNFLYQHGYKVSVIKLPFQSHSDRKIYLKSFISQMDQAHFFCDAITYQELKPLLDQTERSTITVFSEINLHYLPDTHHQILMNHKVKSLSYVLHQIYLKLKKISTPSAAEVGLKIPAKTYDKILDHCVKLAEIDFYEVDLNIQS